MYTHGFDFQLSCIANHHVCPKRGIEETRIMSQLQEWFEKIVGIAAKERDRRELVESLFDRPLFDAAAFHKPACWRRKTMRCFRSSEK
jgi:hypothetical protein